MQISIRIAAFALLFFALAPAVQSSEGLSGKEVKAQIRAQQGLEQNQYYLETINPAVSNYGTEEEKAVLKRCVNRSIQAKISYLAFRFGESYAEIRRTQWMLIRLYEQIVEKSREESHQRLLEYSERIVHSRNVRTRKYLVLGLRDLENARLKVTDSVNMRPWLYLLRLNDLADALKLVRHSDRYAMLIKIEMESIYPIGDSERMPYEQTAGVITSGFPGRQQEFLLRHDDNYFKVNRNSRNLLVDYWENPDLDSLQKPLQGWDDQPLVEPDEE